MERRTEEKSGTGHLHQHRWGKAGAHRGKERATRRTRNPEAEIRQKPSLHDRPRHTSDELPQQHRVSGQPERTRKRTRSISGGRGTDGPNFREASQNAPTGSRQYPRIPHAKCEHPSGRTDGAREGACVSRSATKGVCLSASPWVRSGSPTDSAHHRQLQPIGAELVEPARLPKMFGGESPQPMSRSMA